MAITPTEFDLSANFTTDNFIDTLGQAITTAGLSVPIPAGRLGSVVDNGLENSGAGTASPYEIYQIYDPPHNATRGSGAVLLVRRNASGVLSDVSYLYGGQDYADVPLAVNISQSGTTVTIWQPGHTLQATNTVGFWNRSGSVPNHSGVVANTTVSNRIDITLAASRSAASHGYLYYGRCMGNFSQSGTTVTISTFASHGMNVGDKIYIPCDLTRSGGSAIPGGFYNIASIISDTTFTVTVSTSQSITGTVGWHPTFFVSGDKVGGTSPANDLYVILVAATAGQVDYSNWLSKPTTGAGIFNMGIDSQKVFRDRIYYCRSYQSGAAINLTIRSAMGYLPSGGWVSGYYGLTAHHPYESYKTPPGGQAVTLTALPDMAQASKIVTWVSQVDPKFRVIQFKTVNGYCNLLLIFHSWVPQNPTVYDLNKRPIGGFTMIRQNDARFEFIVPSCQSISRTAIEASFTSSTRDASLGSYDDGYYYSNQLKAYKPTYSTSINIDWTAETVLYQDRMYPSYDLATGPIITGLPLPPGIMPTFYTMPSDFAIIPVGALTVGCGDTYTVSSTEVYTVLMATSELAFVARTT